MPVPPTVTTEPPAPTKPPTVVVFPSETPVVPPPVPTPPSLTPIPPSATAEATSTPLPPTNTPKPSPGVSTPPPTATPVLPPPPPTGVAGETPTPGEPQGTPTLTSLSGTPRVPTPTPPPAASCPNSPQRGFGLLYNDAGHAALRAALGCPNAAEVGFTTAAEQNFEHGYMFWNGDAKRIYVFSTTGSWFVYPDTWVEGEPPANGADAARRATISRCGGFGKLWLETSQVRDMLGWATGQEAGRAGGLAVVRARGDAVDRQPHHPCAL